MRETASQPFPSRFSAIAVNASFVVLLLLFIVGLFIVGPRAGVPEGSKMSLKLVLSQFHLYVLLFLVLLTWRRWVDGPCEFDRIAVVRLFRTVHGSLVRSPQTVYLLTVGCALVMLTVSVRRHLAFESRADLALYAHGLWNTVHGRFHRSSLINDMSLFGNHFEPLQLALVPIYLVAPSPVTLLAVQAVTIALGAVPLYWIARRHLAEYPGLWPLFPVAYLAFVPLRVANRFDYHPSVLAPTLFQFALYFMERRRWGIMVIFLMMAGLLKENLPAAGVTVGLYLAVTARKRVLGATIAALSAVWFYAGLAWIIPAFNPKGYGFLGNYAVLGSSVGDLVSAPFVAPGKIVESLFTRVGWKVSYIVELFGPLVFLPFWSPEGLFLGLPFLAQHLLATTTAQVSLRTHSSAEVVAFIFFGAIYGARRLVTWLPQTRWAPAFWTSSPGRPASILVVALWSATFLFCQWSEVSYVSRYPLSARTDALNAALKLIPEGAAVAAPDRVLAHLTNRRHLYYFPAQEHGFWSSQLPPTSASWRDAEFVIVDEPRLKPSRRVALDTALQEVRERGGRRTFEREGIAVWQLSQEQRPQATR